MTKKKGKVTIDITIGLMCFVLVYVMFLQFKVVEQTDITSIKNKREEELRADLTSWKTKYEEANAQLIDTQNKINEYKQKLENNQAASELLDKELEQTNINLGKTDVQGEGVIITLRDSDKRVMAEDLLLLINELKLAEAEAISINDERVINLTDVVDVGPYINVNMKRLSSPYVVKAIGNQKYMESGLTAKGGYVDTVTDKGKSIVVEGQKNIQIKKYSGDISLRQINVK